jgi:hypothetical protein
MFETIKALLVSLCFAATGAGIAGSITPDTSTPFVSGVVESSSNWATKSDRLDMHSSKADRLATANAAGASGPAPLSSMPRDKRRALFSPRSW